MQTKRLLALNGDIVTLRHPTLDLSMPALVHATVLFNGTPYNLRSYPPTHVHSTKMLSGRYQMGDYELRVTESIDINDVGHAAKRFENLLIGEHGSIAVMTHRSHEEAIELFHTIGPIDTPLGFRIEETNAAPFIIAPTILLRSDPVALLEISALTKEIEAGLPDWQGTPVAGGELFAASLSRSTDYLILVTDSSRTNVMATDPDGIDLLTESVAALEVSWTP